MFDFLKISTKGRVWSLDILRGIAIIMVILAHNPIYPDQRSILYFPFVLLNKIGWSGVDLFFVLSGYLVGGLLLKEYNKKGTIDVRRFIVRRIFKIWPVYYTYLITFLLVYSFANRSDIGYLSSLNKTFSDIWPAFVHIQNYFSSTAIVGWFWSLGVEEHFYIFLPVFFHLSLNSKESGWVKSVHKIAFVFFAFFVGSLILRVFTQQFIEPSKSLYHIFIFPSHLRFDALMSGVCLAAVEVFFPKQYFSLARYKYAFLILGIVGVMTPTLFGNDHQFFLYPWGLSILTLSFLLILMFVSFFKTQTDSVTVQSNSLFFGILILVGKVFSYIGIVSYSIYVWHGYFAKPIANRLTNFLSIDRLDPTFGIISEYIYLLVPIGLGFLSFYCIEEPFLKVRKKLTN